MAIPSLPFLPEEEKSMSKSLIQIANQSSQTVAANGVISLGTVLRRFGCNCRLSGDAIECGGEGYYTIDCNITVAPTAAEAVTVALHKNGTQIPGAVASGNVATGGDSITLPICTTIRQGCCCDSPDSITAVLVSGPGTVENISLRIEKV